jgi:hypothetical protein
MRNRYVILLALAGVAWFLVAGVLGSRGKIIDTARASLSPESRALYPDVTDVLRKDHVKSWMVIFENTKRDDGVWVMVDYHGEVVTAGRVYADH